MTTATTTQTPATRNEGYGFHGEMSMFLRNQHEQVKAAWAAAIAEITSASSLTATQARDWLDSRSGRHFANGVADKQAGGLDLNAAIKASVQQQVAWGAF